MGKSAIKRVKILDYKVKASSGDDTADYLDGKVDDINITISGDKITVKSNSNLENAINTRFGSDILVVGTGCEYTSIQDAMDDASSGDEILVTPGTYTEQVTYGDDNISVISHGGKEITTITYEDATVVNFSTKSGCTLRGFTISMADINSATDYPVTGANDDASDYNYIIDCDIILNSTGPYNTQTALHLTDGNWRLQDTNVTVNASYSGASDNSAYCIFTTNTTNAVNVDLVNVKATITHSATDRSYVMAIINQGSGTFNLWNVKITVDTATAHGNLAYAAGIDNITKGGTTNIYSADIDVYNSNGSGHAYGIYLNSGTINIYNVRVDATCSGTENWCRIDSGGTVNNYGAISTDGTLENSGTYTGGGNRYVKRPGNISSYDLTETGMTTDGNWHDWDISSVVPKGARLVHISALFRDDAVGKALGFRKNGDGSYDPTYRYTQVADADYGCDYIVPVDDAGIIEYYASNTTWTSIDLKIRGWWI